ncbi:hypothetical protein AB0I60_04610 [Actinosynnema sp. NPDC050436]|uniref:hypothetical protein n=1 Tax=Actinosynnema sp. NPDC050436 TaxID=3155659 RepID=UPI003411D602
MISRRHLLVAAGSSLAVAATGCGAVAKTVAAEPAQMWLSALGTALTAELAGTLTEAGKWVFEKAWEQWAEPTRNVWDQQQSEGFGFIGTTVYGHVIPETTLVSFHREAKVDRQSDRLGCVRATGEAIVLENWAWRGLMAFIKAEVGEKEDKDRVHLMQLLAKTVMPHGAAVPAKTPMKTVEYVNYPARDGGVEIVKFTDGGKAKVTVTASGYHSDAAGSPTTATFDLV